MSVEIRDVADGLWLWRQRHPSWTEGEDWQGWVSSLAAESRGVATIIDALAPPPDAREVMERPVFLPEQRAIVFADGMSGEEGILRPWATPWHEERVLPALRELLELDSEHVLVSQANPPTPVTISSPRSGGSRSG